MLEKVLNITVFIEIVEMRSLRIHQLKSNVISAVVSFTKSITHA